MPKIATTRVVLLLLALQLLENHPLIHATLRLLEKPPLVETSLLDTSLLEALLVETLLVVIGGHATEPTRARCSE